MVGSHCKSIFIQSNDWGKRVGVLTFALSKAVTVAVCIATILLTKCLFLSKLLSLSDTIDKFSSKTKAFVLFYRSKFVVILFINKWHVSSSLIVFKVSVRHSNQKIFIKLSGKLPALLKPFWTQSWTLRKISACSRR